MIREKLSSEACRYARFWRVTRGLRSVNQGSNMFPKLRKCRSVVVQLAFSKLSNNQLNQLNQLMDPEFHRRQVKPITASVDPCNAALTALFHHYRHCEHGASEDARSPSLPPLAQVNL